MITAEEYKNIKEELTKTNNRIASLQGQRAALVSQIKQILSSHGVSTVTELKELCSKKEKEAEELAEKVRNYLNKVNPKIKEAEDALLWSK